MQFVFCILFFNQFDAFEKVFSKCFNNFDVLSFIISNIRPLRGEGGKWLTLKIMYFIIRPTCSSYDYEREKKSKSEQKRTRNASD
jgi:hypothetical protein